MQANLRSEMPQKVLRVGLHFGLLGMNSQRDGSGQRGGGADEAPVSNGKGSFFSLFGPFRAVMALVFNGFCSICNANDIIMVL